MDGTTPPKSMYSRPRRRASNTSNASSVSLPNLASSAKVPASQKATVYSVFIEGDAGGIEMQHSCEKLSAAIKLRDKYKTIDKGQKEPNEKLTPPIPLGVDDGVFHFNEQRSTVVPWEQFYDDVATLMDIIQDPQCQATCRYRLQVVEEKFNIYKISNSELEEGADRYRRGGGVFADCTKVDNCVYLDTCVNAMTLLGHIQVVHERDGDEVVRLVGDRQEPQTLRRLFEVSDIQDPSQLTVEGLGLHPSSERRLQKFDVLDPEMNRAGKGCAEILRLFLSRHNMNDGKYLAEAIRPVLTRSEQRAKYVECAEMVVEFHGLQEDEWDKLAKWFVHHDLTETTARTNRWIIALPRQTIRRESFAKTPEGAFEFHQKHLENIFLPLFLATLAPEDPRHTDIAQMLMNVGAIMIVSDEEVRESDFTRKRRKPAEVPWSEHVCDLYFAYYIWANIVTLNAFRKRKGLNTIQFRAVAGERSTHLDSLVYSYLLGDAVTQGLLLEHQPVLQYLYGIQRIGICMSPLGQNALSVPYMDNPLPSFFRRGLLISLCTEHPLYFHHSEDPLIEEYGTCTKLYKLSAVDMCELAHNSVVISSFSEQSKAQWLGEAYVTEGIRGNSMEFSNVPTSRLELRADSWATERQILQTSLGASDSSSHTGGGGESSAGGGGGGGSMLARVPYLVTDPNEHFPRIAFVGPFERDSTHAQVAQLLHKALELRKQYVWGAKHVNRGFLRNILQQHELIENAFKRNDNFDEDEWMFKTVEGVVVPHEVHQIPRLPKDMFRFDEFRVHIQEIKAICDHLHVKNFAIRRLSLLEHKFKLHLAVNHSLEAGSTAEKASQNRDFYQSTKVDTNVRMEGGMTARHLLNFIISKANNNGDDIVAQHKGKEPQTLRQLLHDLKISPEFLTVDDLNVQVDANTMTSALQFTPEIKDPLLTLLLKTDNQMKGRYFAELTKLTFENFKRDQFTFAENRLPIYGASIKEWSLLSDWFDTHGMASFNNQWMIQIPRIYSYLRKKGKVNNFAEYLENIFQPLWDVSLHPSKDPRLFHFVNHISGFDCIEDERRVDMPLSMATKPPQEWTSEEEPPYNYYLYYVWANVFSINDFRQKRSFSTFSFRPSCGETGSAEHVVGGFLLANAINYGVRLQDEAALQYLFYLAQIGVAVCPLSNNTKVLDFLDNPFPELFRRGLNVSLCTDAPLQFHYTQEPLLEEYSIASKVWKLSPSDMCEIARNSVIQSGFDSQFKQARLGELFFLSSSKANDPTRTHLSNVRVAYRWDTYHTEVSLLEHVSGLRFERAMWTHEEEEKKLLEWTEAKRKKVEASLGGIIDAQQDEADIQKLNSQRSLMVKQMNELKKTLAELQRQNKQLSEKLAEESAKDQAAQALRRHAETERLQAHSAAETARRSRASGDLDDDSKPFADSEGDDTESGDDENVLVPQSFSEGGDVASSRDAARSPPDRPVIGAAVGTRAMDASGTTLPRLFSGSGTKVDSFESIGGNSALGSTSLAHITSSGQLGSLRRDKSTAKSHASAAASAAAGTRALLNASEGFFTSSSHAGQGDGQPDLLPSPPPRGVGGASATSVPSAFLGDPLSEFLKNSQAELDRMVNGRRTSLTGVGGGNTGTSGNTGGGGLAVPKQQMRVMSADHANSGISSHRPAPIGAPGVLPASAFPRGKELAMPLSPGTQRSSPQVSIRTSVPSKRH